MTQGDYNPLNIWANVFWLPQTRGQRCQETSTSQIKQLHYAETHKLLSCLGNITSAKRVFYLKPQVVLENYNSVQAHCKLDGGCVSVEKMVWLKGTGCRYWIFFDTVCVVEQTPIVESQEFVKGHLKSGSSINLKGDRPSSAQRWHFKRWWARARPLLTERSVTPTSSSKTSLGSN